MTREQILELLAKAKAAYPRQVLQPDTISVYAEHLLDLPYEAAARGLQSHVVQSAFFPSVAEWRRLATCGEGEAALPDAGKAWGEVQEAIRWVGMHRQPTWSTPVLEHAVARIGWANICTDENVSATRAHFFRVYEEARQEVADGRLMHGLPSPTRSPGHQLVDSVAAALRGRE